MDYQEVEEGYARSLVGTHKPLLLVTATAVETAELHKHLRPVEGEHLIVCYKGSIKYYLGLFGKYLVVHVECLRMGTGQQGGSLETSTEAINQWKPGAVVMVGIAFGVKPNEQRVGDVLISESTIPYEIAKLTKGDTQYRAAVPPAGNTLLSRFKQNRTWQYPLPSGQIARKLPGAVLSGEKLIDDLEERNALVADHPHAIGGEMEGAGVASAAHDDHLEWILVKAICDFADGNKSVEKERNQEIAAASSVSLCLDVFSSEVAFVSLGMQPYVQERKQHDGAVRPASRVLFDKYTAEDEAYYIKRLLDSEVSAGLKYYGLWLFGPSGFGKSCLAIRNLTQSSAQYVQVTLANCQGRSIDDFFHHILQELKSIFGLELSTSLLNYTASTKLISTLLHERFSGQEVVLYIEEIPISTDVEYQEFTQKLVAHIIGDTKGSGVAANIKYVLSSIQNPTVHIKDYQAKVKERMLFLEVKPWSDSDVQALVAVLEKGLSISLGGTASLVGAAKGSPRYCKKCLRNVLVGIDASGRIDLTSAITRTTQELS